MTRLKDERCRFCGTRGELRRMPGSDLLECDACGEVMIQPLHADWKIGAVSFGKAALA